MQLNLSENIKKYRKEMNLTQEDLAEAFGITVGAVSKWESGNTVPDILTLMELADFFNISVDVLLGYNLSSKSIDDISKKINNLTREQKFEEAVTEADKALVRYPTSFKIIQACASLYSILFTVSHKKKDAKRAVELHEKSLNYLAQNDDPDYSEFSIRMDIAKLKSDLDPEGALSEFNRINYMGIANIDIARLLYNKGEIDEALDRYTKAFFYNLISEYVLSLNMSLAIASRCTKKDYREALELINRSIAYIDSVGVGKICYITKMKVIMLAVKAIALACLKEYDSMRLSLDEAYELAAEFDASPNNTFKGGINFWHAKEDFKPFASDDLGQGALESIDRLFTNRPPKLQEKLDKESEEAHKYWESIRHKSPDFVKTI